MYMQVMESVEDCRIIRAVCNVIKVQSWKKIRNKKGIKNVMLITFLENKVKVTKSQLYSYVQGAIVGASAVYQKHET